MIHGSSTPLRSLTKWTSNATVRTERRDGLQIKTTCNQFHKTKGGSCSEFPVILQSRNKRTAIDTTIYGVPESYAVNDGDHSYGDFRATICTSWATCSSVPLVTPMRFISASTIIVATSTIRYLAFHSSF